MPKPRPLERSKGIERDARLCVIAVEGAVTEKTYLEGIINSPKIQVILLPAVDGRSAPKHLVERIDEFRAKHDYQADDVAYAVFDRDSRKPPELRRFYRLCSQKRINPIESNPCFELWLLLHFEHVPRSATSKDEIEMRLRSHVGGYSHSFLDVTKFIGKVGVALERAAELDGGEPWPENPCTHMHRMMNEILLLDPKSIV